MLKTFRLNRFNACCLAQGSDALIQGKPCLSHSAWLRTGYTSWYALLSFHPSHTMRLGWPATQMSDSYDPHMSS
jgi:hypothetical protein